jgi:hypothetical protein
MNEEKRSRIYDMLEKIEHNETKRSKFVSWFHRMAWYADKGFPLSESQLDETIEFLNKLIKE